MRVVDSSLAGTDTFGIAAMPVDLGRARRAASPCRIQAAQDGCEVSACVPLHRQTAIFCSKDFPHST